MCSTLTFANRIDRGYKALEMRDYFKAKKLFTKGLKYNETAAAQGLAIIYYRSDNPFHNYDSAYVYILKSVEGWDMTKQRKKEKWKDYGFTQDSLYALRQAISRQFYMKANKSGSVEALTEFTLMHPWAKEKDAVIATRDSLAFFIAVNKNTSTAYKSYMEAYPQSTYAGLAEQNYYDTQYIETTTSGNLSSFEAFIENNPTSPMRMEAERNVFELVTKSNRLASFVQFVNTYTQSHYMDTAWLQMYQVYMSTYSEERMNEFLMSYATPFADRIERDIMMFDSIALPFVSDYNYGFMNIEGTAMIEAEYDFVGFFQEGLAVVVRNNKYGFINKHNELQIPIVFESASEFVNGRAIVEQEGKIGMIDRNGRFIFDCIYDDLGTFSEGMVYAQFGDKYGYYNEQGELKVPHEFDDAYDFNAGVAKVEQGNKQGYIDCFGKYVVPLSYSKIDVFYDTLYTFMQDGLYGIMNHRCQIFVEPIYTEIGTVNNGLAIAATQDRLVYLDTLGQLAIDNNYGVFPNYLLKGEFSKEVAIAYKDGKYGRISTRDDIVTNFELENIGQGIDYYPAQKEGEWGLFSAQNKVLISPMYQSLQLVGKKYLIAVQNDTTGVLDNNGNIVVPFSFNEIQAIGSELFMVQQNGKFGVYRGEKLIIPFKFDQIGIFDKDFLFLNKGGELLYYSLDNGWIIEMKD